MTIEKIIVAKKGVPMFNEQFDESGNKTRGSNIIALCVASVLIIGVFVYIVIAGV